MSRRTIRTAISEVINDLRALNIDDFISPVFIYEKLLEYNAVFIKQEADKRRLFTSVDLWTTIPCFPMQKADLIECCEIDAKSCNTLMKSVFKVPRTYTANVGDLLTEIAAVDYNKFYRLVTIRDWNNIQKREFQDKRVGYAFVHNGYLFIPNNTVEIISLTGAFIDPLEIEEISNNSTCCGCSSTEEIPCKKFLDFTFNCPEYLWAVVRQNAVKDLFSFYKQNIVDENPDLDSNNKTKPNNAS